MKAVPRISAKMREDGKYLLSVRIDISRVNRPYIPTNISIKSSWFKMKDKTRAGYMKVPRLGTCSIEEYDEAVRAQDALSEFCNRLERLCFVCRSHAIKKEWLIEMMQVTKGVKTADITLDYILSIQTSSRKTENDSVEYWFNRYMDSKPRAKSTKASNYAHYRTLCRFVEYKKATDLRFKKDFSFTLSTLTYDLLKEFVDYYPIEYRYVIDYPALYDSILSKYPTETGGRHKNKVEPRSINTTSKMIKNLKAFTRWLWEDERLPRDPMKHIITPTQQYATPIVLSKVERDKLISTNYSEDDLFAVADIFYAQCWLGCRISDLLSLKWHNLTPQASGYRLCYTEGKTKNERTLPITNHKVIDIINKYKGTNGDNIFPSIASATLDLKLKDVAKECGFRREVDYLENDVIVKKPLCEVISSHVGRKTFVNLAHIAAAGDLAKTCKMSGHATSSHSVHRYIDPREEDLQRQILSMME